jgi:TAZ zinc finger
VCRSTKWMMLHVRDCSGTTITDDVCPFPWCRKVKHLLYHLLSCTEPQECPICCGAELDYNWSRLKHLNTFRMKPAREMLVQRFGDGCGVVERGNSDPQQRSSAGTPKQANAITDVNVTVVVERPLPPLATENVPVPSNDDSVLTSTCAGRSGAAQNPTDPVVSDATMMPNSVVCINNTTSQEEERSVTNTKNIIGGRRVTSTADDLSPSHNTHIYPLVAPMSGGPVDEPTVETLKVR